MPRGGRRTGTPGKSYPNRSDLTAQPVRTAPGQPYGQAGQQAAAQQQIPLPQTSSPVPAPNAPIVPPAPGMLTGPSLRPGEPVTAGLTVGAGPGPEAVTGGAPGDQVLANLYRAYQTAPTEGLRALIAQTEQLRGSLR